MSTHVAEPEELPLDTPLDEVPPDETPLDDPPPEDVPPDDVPPDEAPLEEPDEPLPGDPPTLPPQARNRHPTSANDATERLDMAAPHTMRMPPGPAGANANDLAVVRTRRGTACVSGGPGAGASRSGGRSAARRSQRQRRRRHRGR